MLGSILAWLGCGTAHAPGVAYYKTFSGYDLPWKPRRETMEAEALRLTAYLKVTYDQHGRMVVLEKWLRGKLWFRHDYEYDADGEPLRVTISHPGHEPVVRDL